MVHTCPSLNLDPNEYFTDEINIEDIYFLLWYYISMTQYDATIISPVIHEWSGPGKGISLC